MTQVSLQLFGPFQLKIDGQPVQDFRSNKVRALLGYLALQARPVERGTLANLLWPDMTEQKAGRISDDEMVGYFLARPDNQRLREQLSQR